MREFWEWLLDLGQTLALAFMAWGLYVRPWLRQRDYNKSNGLEDLDDLYARVHRS